MGASDRLAAVPLRVRVLGGFGVEGVDERALGTRKARTVLKRLAVAAGAPVPVDELAGAVWGDDLPSRPHDQLSVLVSRLRGVVGADRLARTDAGYALHADWLDIIELEARSSEVEQRLHSGEGGAALAAANAALALARGPLLPEEDAPWVDRARRGADRLVARARLLAAEAALAAGEVMAARAAAQGALDYDPYDEAALRLVMRADVCGGRPAAALAAYADVRHRLSEDLGVDPGPETEDLHTAILRGELPGRSPATELAADLVGRGAELTALDALLRRASAGEPAAVVVEAEAGMGKSALLAVWGARHARAALVVAGRCDELGGDLPLQPVIDGLAAHLGSLGRAAASALLGAEAAVLDPLLGRGAVPLAPPTVTTVADQAAGRVALSGALAAVLTRAAGARPLVLVVDDLHRAAAGTAEFLSFALRRVPRVLVVAARRAQSGPDLPAAVRIRLAPLDVGDAAALVGPARAAELHARSGGHPLFLRELAARPEGVLPDSIVDAVRGHLAGLGDAAGPVEVAAVCGTEVDVELVAAVIGAPVSTVLDGLELAVRANLMAPRGTALAFTHELIREAIEAAASPSRRTAIHRAAVAHLASRPDADPLPMARHARLGGDAHVAARALAAAAGRSAERFELTAAVALLDEAIDLDDTAAVRLARGRLRLAQLDLDGAGDDAARSIALGAGVAGFELAGWVAYYVRDYDSAVRYADEGVERAGGDDAVRASCLALGGRIRHTRGELADAACRLEEGVRVAPPAVRGVVQVWHAQLLAHRGEIDAAVDTARRGLLDPHLAHPFAAGHGRFTLIYALALGGRWGDALDVVDDLDRLVVRLGDRRFPPLAANMRGWLLRGSGQLDAARELHLAARQMTAAPTMREAHYAAALDLAELDLAEGDAARAATSLAACGAIAEWTGSMSWRHRNRYRLLADRVVSAGGDHDAAAEDARDVAASASARGDPRYALRARLVAVGADARGGRRPDADDLHRLVDAFIPLSGPDGWRDLAELAGATGSDAVWQRAEVEAAGLVHDAARHPGAGGTDAVAGAVRRQLDRLRP